MIHALGSAWATGYSLLRALGSASCDIAYETAGVRFVTGGYCIWRYHTRDREKFYYGHWVLVFVISGTRQVVRRALGSASFHITYEPAIGTFLYGHEVFVTSHTRHGVRFVTGIVLCILRYHTRDRGYDLLRALGSASCDITHESRGTVYDGHWVLGLMISRTKQGVRFVTAFGLHLLIFHSSFCVITHETESTICYGHWVLHLVISPTNRRGYSLSAAGLGILLIAHETRGTVCCGQRALHLVIPHTRQGGSFVTGIVLCIL